MGAGMNPQTPIEASAEGLDTTITTSCHRRARPTKTPSDTSLRPSRPSRRDLDYLVVHVVAVLCGSGVFGVLTVVLISQKVIGQVAGIAIATIGSVVIAGITKITQVTRRRSRA